MRSPLKLVVPHSNANHTFMMAMVGMAVNLNRQKRAIHR